MNKYFISAFAASLLCLQAAYASDCIRNIPGHYIDRFANDSSGSPLSTTINDGTVFDQLTGLTWMRCDVDSSWNIVTQLCSFDTNLQNQEIHIKYSWQDALLEVQKVNNGALGGGRFNYNDWRLPNIKEIASLQDLSCVDAELGTNDIAIDDDVFIYPLASYWSSTPARTKPGRSLNNGLDTNPPNAWKMNFKVGSFGAEPAFITEKNSVRLVRGFSTQ